MKNDLRKGFIFTAIGKYSNMIVTLLLNAILSRLLTPKEYGVVAVLTVFIVFFQMISDIGLGPAIVQSKDLKSRDYSILLNFASLLALLLSIVFGFSGTIISKFYSDNQYILLSWFATPLILFYGMNSISNALLLKEKKFLILNLNSVISSVIGGGTGILAAYSGMGATSIIISNSILALCLFFLNLRAAKIKFIPSLDMSPIKKVSNFATNQFLFNILVYFSKNSDNILIGRYLGDSSLGNYNKAYQLLMYPNNILMGIINPVIQSVFSDFRGEVKPIRDSFIKIIHVVLIVGMPVSFFLSDNAELIINFIFGNQWGSAVEPFKILAISVWIQMLLSLSGVAFQTVNRTRIMLYSGVVSSGITIFSVIIGLFLGDIISVSYCLLIGYFINFFVTYYLMVVIAFKLRFFEFFKEFKNPLIITFGTFIFGKLLSQLPLISNLKNVFIKLLIKGIFFTVIYLFFLILLNEFKMIISVFKKNK